MPSDLRLRYSDDLDVCKYNEKYPSDANTDNTFTLW